jgi:protein-tyrosine phosphatase
MIRVLFVCLGNICRSPMAEAVFAHKVRAAGLADMIDTDSAGTGHWHVGSPPHHGTRRILAKYAIDYRHAARQIVASDLEKFDYVMTMDADNYENVRAMGVGKALVRPFLYYAPGASATEVPDPYFTGNFQEVFDLVDTASEGLLAAIRSDHGIAG